MNVEADKRIGENLKRLRERAGMTQATLAAKMQLCGYDITRSAVAKLEVGQRHLYSREVILLHDILQASYDEIYDLAPINNENGEVQ